MHIKIFVTIIFVIAAGAAVRYFTFSSDVPVDTEVQNDTNEPVDIKPEYKTVSDDADYFTVDVPADWILESEEPREGVLTSLVVQSPDFNQLTERNEIVNTNLVSYENGARVLIFVTEDIETNIPDGETMIEYPVEIDGITATYRELKESHVSQGRLLDARFVHDGLEYILQFRYNPHTYPEGSDMFFQIFSSINLN